MCLCLTQQALKSAFYRVKVTDEVLAKLNMSKPKGIIHRDKIFFMIYVKTNNGNTLHMCTNILCWVKVIKLSAKLYPNVCSCTSCGYVYKSFMCALYIWDFYEQCGSCMYKTRVAGRLNCRCFRLGIEVL